MNIAGNVGPAEIESASSFDEGIAACHRGARPGERRGPGRRPSPEAAGDTAVADRVADEIVRVLGKAFRPAAVRVVEDLPRTRSAKIMRRVVRALALGDDPGDLSSLENPESLEGIGRL